MGNRKELLTIDYDRDKIEYKDNQTKEENIIINFKLKRAELINKILEKNCKNIVYVVIISILKIPTFEAMDDK